MEIIINPCFYKKMKKHVRSSPSEEVCGLLGGKGSSVEVVIPITNIHHSATRFEMDPNEQLRAFVDLENERLNLIGIYHSHPNGPPVPSETDIELFYYPGCALIIWSPSKGHWQLHSFEISNLTYKELSTSYSMKVKRNGV